MAGLPTSPAAKHKATSSAFRRAARARLSRGESFTHAVIFADRLVCSNVTEAHHKQPQISESLCSPLCRLCCVLLRDRRLCAQLAIAPTRDLAAVPTVPLGLDTLAPGLYARYADLHSSRESHRSITCCLADHRSPRQDVPWDRAVRNDPRRTYQRLGVSSAYGYHPRLDDCPSEAGALEACFWVPQWPGSSEPDPQTRLQRPGFEQLELERRATHVADFPCAV